MTMIKNVLLKHRRNQHGFGVSITRYVDDKLTEGFVLHSCDSEQEQDDYIAALRKVISIELEELL